MNFYSARRWSIYSGRGWSIWTGGGGHFESVKGGQFNRSFHKASEERINAFEKRINLSLDNTIKVAESTVNRSIERLTDAEANNKIKHTEQVDKYDKMAKVIHEKYESLRINTMSFAGGVNARLSFVFNQFALNAERLRDFKNCFSYSVFSVNCQVLHFEGVVKSEEKDLIINDCIVDMNRLMNLTKANRFEFNAMEKENLLNALNEFFRFKNNEISMSAMKLITYVDSCKVIA